MFAYKVTAKEYLKNHDISKLSLEQINNMCRLLLAVNQVRQLYKVPMRVSSGWRPPEYNKKVNGAANSPHISCEAIDIFDPKQDFKHWILQNIKIMEDLGLWIENFDQTPSWVHLDIRPRATRIFNK